MRSVNKIQPFTVTLKIDNSYHIRAKSRIF